MKERLLSLACSGESIEKVLTLYYHAMISNPDFYSKYNVILFYGNNLPKKNKGLSAHGTLSFYDQYFVKCQYLPPCSKEYYWEHAKSIISSLVINGHFTSRQANRLLENKEVFWNGIKYLPFYYIYPKFVNDVVRCACREFNILKLESIYLEKNYIKAIMKIFNNKNAYSIYGLTAYGNISHFYFDYTDINEQIHLLTELGKQSVLSGNSALLIWIIKTRIGKHTVVGYRNRKNNIRPNREAALLDLLDGQESVQEPKNYEFNKYFAGISASLSMEERANMAFVIGYQRFIDECLSRWNIDINQDNFGES